MLDKEIALNWQSEKSRLATEFGALVAGGINCQAITALDRNDIPFADAGSEGGKGGSGGTGGSAGQAGSGVVGGIGGAGGSGDKAERRAHAGIKLSTRWRNATTAT